MMMQGLGGALITGVAGLLLFWGSGELVSDYIEPERKLPPMNRLHIENVEIQVDGDEYMVEFKRRADRYPPQGPAMNVDWVAQIVDEKGRVRCAGRSRSPTTIEKRDDPIKLPMTVWVGADTCDLAGAKVLQACGVWTWHDRYGRQGHTDFCSNFFVVNAMGGLGIRPGK